MRRSYRQRIPIQSTSYSRYPTAAQNIAAQYRYKAAEEARRDRSTRRIQNVSFLEFPPQSLEDFSTLAECTSEYSGLSGFEEPRARVTYSCALALDSAVCLASFFLIWVSECLYACLSEPRGVHDDAQRRKWYQQYNMHTTGMWQSAVGLESTRNAHTHS